MNIFQGHISTFLKRFLLFAFFIALAFVLMLFFTLRKVRDRYNLTLPAQAELLIVGHSHPGCAVNDSLWPQAINVSKTGECYFYSGQKILPLLAANPQIKEVGIEISHNQFLNVMDKWWVDDEHIQRGIKSYSPWYSAEDWWALSTKNPLGVLESSVVVLQKWGLHPPASGSAVMKSADWGGYLRLDVKPAEQWKKKPEALAASDMIWAENNANHLVALVREIEYRGVAVFFFRTPTHPWAPRPFDQEINRWLDSQFKSIPFINLDGSITADSCFSDLEHLNYIGAKQFTPWLRFMHDQVMHPQDKTWATR